MGKFKASHDVVQSRRGWPFLLKVMAWGLLVFATLPSGAADERAVKTKVPPVYPEIAKRMRVTGVVKIEATVDAEGRVMAVKTVNGNRVLSEAAEDAVRKWKFASGAGEATVQVDVNFAMTAVQ